jgi:dTMP kinase
MLLDPDHAAMCDRAEALLFAADRAQHVHEVVEPALASGRHVVTDRFAASSLAYQSFGRGLPLDRRAGALGVRRRRGLARPDRAARAAAEVARARLGDLDRMEGVGPEFHQRVADGFDALSAADPGPLGPGRRHGSIDEVAERVRAAVAERLGEWRPA